MEWVMPQEIGIAIPNGWETTSSPEPPEPGSCPATTTTSTSKLLLPTPPSTPTMHTLDTAPPGDTLISTDSSVTFPQETGNDSSITIGDSDPKVSKLKFSTSKLKKSRSKTRRRQLPTTLRRRSRSLQILTTNSPMFWGMRRRARCRPSRRTSLCSRNTPTLR
uniref:Assembly activation protein n=1 Tax=Pacific black duck adeno-associated virus TaxID=2759417 RepID=A0A7D7AHX9_9VIRU|nr:assembly activation protein [Pacific black duck adeno-associated virus]